MEQLNALLERKRALAAEFTRLKAELQMPSGGLMGLLSADLSQFKPFASVMTELMEVTDQITEIMAEKLAELSEKMEH